MIRQPHLASAREAHSSHFFAVSFVIYVNCQSGMAGTADRPASEQSNQLITGEREAIASEICGSCANVRYGLVSNHV